MFIPLFGSFLPEREFPALLAGGITGYIIYDLSHYFVHHLSVEGKKKSPLIKFFRNLKRYHMYHHYKDDTKGFGVSSKFWDVIFGT